MFIMDKGCLEVFIQSGIFRKFPLVHYEVVEACVHTMRDEDLIIIPKHTLPYTLKEIGFVEMLLGIAFEQNDYDTLVSLDPVIAIGTRYRGVAALMATSIEQIVEHVFFDFHPKRIAHAH